MDRMTKGTFDPADPAAFRDLPPAADLCRRLEAEYEGALTGAARLSCRVAAEPAVRQRLGDLGMRVADNASPAYAATWLEAERTKWEAIIREAGIRAD